jgi:hypothetical protein
LSSLPLLVLPVQQDWSPLAVLLFMGLTPTCCLLSWLPALMLTDEDVPIPPCCIDATCLMTGTM